jgi:hypothetical protein
VFDQLFEGVFLVFGEVFFWCLCSVLRGFCDVVNALALRLAMPRNLPRNFSPRGENFAAIVGIGNNLAAFLSVIESRKVLIPRWVYDDAAVLFLNAGATLQFLRTNQIGGQDPDIIPRAPGFD